MSVTNSVPLNTGSAKEREREREQERERERESERCMNKGVEFRFSAVLLAALKLMFTAENYLRS